MARCGDNDEVRSGSVISDFWYLTEESAIRILAVAGELDYRWRRDDPLGVARGIVEMAEAGLGDPRELEDGHLGVAQAVMRIAHAARRESGQTMKVGRACSRVHRTLVSFHDGANPFELGRVAGRPPQAVLGHLLTLADHGMAYPAGRARWKAIERKDTHPAHEPAQFAG